MGKLDTPTPDKENESTGDISEPVAEYVASAPEPDTPAKPSRWLSLRRLVKNKKFWMITSGVVAALLILGLFVEPVKFTVLNLFSKGSAEFVVVDNATLAPVEGATISIGNQRAQTNKSGKVTVKKLHYGKATYKIEKENYTAVTGDTKIKPGGSLVGPIKFRSQGLPVKITAVNKLSNEAVKKFVVKIADSNVSAVADSNGMALLKVSPIKVGEITLVVTSDGFNETEQKVTLKQGSGQAVSIGLVPAGKHFFMSNRTGKMAVFSANLDGSNQQEIVTGAESSSEDSSAQLLIAPDNKRAALVSKRDLQRGPGGELLPALFVIDLEQKTIKRIDEGAPNFTLVGWTNNNQLLYKVGHNTYDRADNMKIKLADVTTSRLETLHSQKADSYVYFYEEDRTHAYFINYDSSVELYGLIGLDVKTKAKKRLYQFPPYEVIHSKPYILSFNYETKWYQLDMKTQQVKEGRAVDTNRLMIVSPDQERTAWVEVRDGKGTIVLGDREGANPKQVTKGVNVSNIVHWPSNDYIVYHSSTVGETAHYIVHTPTGTITKISDVYVPTGYGHGY